MFKNRRAVSTALALLLTIFLLAACGGQEPEETEASPTTGDTGAFEITGTVQQVEIEDGGTSPGGTATPTATGTGTGTNTSPAAGGTASPAGPLARLVVEVESINEGPAELCDVEEGDEVTLTVTPTTAIDPQRSLQDLDEIEGRSIRAEGNAEELAGEDRGGNPAAQEEDVSPGTAASPQGTGGPSPTGGASPTPTGGENPAATGGVGGGQDPEAGCHFEVARLTIEEEEGGQGGNTDAPGGTQGGGNAGTGTGTGTGGAGTGTGTGAGAGAGTGSPGANQGAAGSPTPTMQGNARTPTGASPTSAGGGT